MGMRTLHLRRRAVSTLFLGILGAVLLLPLTALALDVNAALEGAEGTPLESYDTSAGWTVGISSPTSIEMYKEVSGNEDHTNGLGGGAAIQIDQVLPGSELDVQFGRIFTSFEDFRTRLPRDGEAEVADERFGYRFEETTLGGMRAYRGYGELHDDVNPDHRRNEHYYIPSGDGGIYIIAQATLFWPVEWDENNNPISQYHKWEPINADLDAMLASLRFKPLAEAGAVDYGAPQGAPDGPASPWRTVAGGALAVAAAAAALVGVAASAAAQKGERLDPTKPVGYVLQLSTHEIALTAGQSSRFTVTAHQVMSDGSTRPAPDAQIALEPPGTVSAQPAAGAGSVEALVWASAPLPAGAALTVRATSPLGGTASSVALTSAEETRIVTRFEPADKGPLRADGTDSVTLVAQIALSAADAANPSLDVAQANSSIEISSASEWLDLSQTVDYGTERAARIQASQPDPTSAVQPPESAQVKVTAQVGATPLAANVAVPLARLPEIDARPDSVAFALDSGGSAEIAVWIDNGAGIEWEFETAWAEGSAALAETGFERTAPTTGTLTLTEAASGKTDAMRPQTAATLRVIASAEGYEPIERRIKVVVAQEGLFVDLTNTDPSTGAFGVRADGSGEPTRVDVRVFVRNGDTGAITPDIDLAQQVVFEAPEEAGTVAAAALGAGGFSAQPAGVRPANVPSAMFDFALANPLPTGGDVLSAGVNASVPGRGEAAFTAVVPLRLHGVNTDPFSAAWEIELERCRYIIDTYVPAEHRSRLHELVNARSKTMGAEGLYKMRHTLWVFARDQLVKEAHEHLDAAWWYEQIEDTLDWVSWCGDIALGVASGAFVGVVGSVAIGMLKPLLVSAMETWINGGSLEDWLLAQTSLLTGVLEGALTDPDFLTKLSGDKKAIGWALFITYYFAKELYNDPNLSVTNAMKNVGRQLRDEGLIMFLRKIAGMKGGAGIDDARAKGKKGAPTPDAPRAKATGPGAPDAPRAKTPGPGAPDAPRAKTPGAPTPDAPRAKTPAAAPDATPARPKAADAGADAGRPKPATPDADTARPKPGDADADAARPKDKPAPDAEKAADTPADKKPEKPKPEKVVEKAPEQPAEAPAEPKRAPDPRKASREPAKRAAAIADDIAAKTGGGKDLDLKTTMEIMVDPDAMRELRKSDPAAWKKFHETRSKAYEAHDAKLKDWIRDNVPDAQGKQIEVESFGTPDGVDRDFRAGYVVTDPATGRKQFIEIKKEKWAGKSAEIFAKETGGPTDPAGAAKWAKDHQQLATDQYHAEASVDMADQANLYNEKTGQWEKQQVTPNADLVKEGKSTLRDPDGYGKTYETKVIEAYAEGNKLDAYKQADKAVHSLEGVRDGYAKQGYGVKDLPPKVDAGLQAIKDVQSGKLTPETADAQLRKLGNSGGLPDFMEKVSGQFAGLKWARKS